MKIDQNTSRGPEAWAMLLLYAGWDRAADEIFVVVEKRRRATAQESAELADASGVREFEAMSIDAPV